MLLRSLKSISGDSLVFGLTGILGRSIGFFLIPVYTRLLAPSDYGVMSVVGTTGQVLSIVLSMGLPGAVFRYLYEYSDQELKAYLGTIAIFQNAAGAALCAIMVLLAKPLAGLLFGEPAYGAYLALTVAQVFLTLVTNIPTQVLIARRQTWLFLAVSSIGTLLGAAVPIYLIGVCRMGLKGVFIGAVAAQGMSWLIYAWLLLREVKWAYHWKHVAGSLAYGLPLVPHLLCHWVMNYIDRIMLQRMVSTQEAGLYSLGYNFGLIMMMIVGSINTAWAPWFYRQNTDDPEGTRRLYGRILTYYTVLVAWCFLGIAGLSREVIQVMADARFHTAHMVVPAVTLGYAFQGFYFMSVNQLFFYKKTGYLPFLSAVAAATNIALNIWMIPRWGMMGAAWATAASLFVLFSVVAVVSQRIYPIGLEWARLAKSLAATGAAYVALFWLVRFPLWTAIGMKLAVLAAFPMLLLAIGFYQRKELELAKNFLWRR